VGSVLVVVIVGVIVAVAVATVRGGAKPATRPEPAHRAAIDWGEPTPLVDGDVDPEPVPEGEVLRDEEGVLHRLRALALLLVVVGALGAAAAALLGVAVVVAARGIDGALG
jgi:hypothetical protein